jgi:arylsulfatase A-like enzyme
MNSTLLAFLAVVASVMVRAAEPPNIVFILADDLGYGDVHCNFPEGKIATPNIDRLASQGMRFTDAHTTSSVCTPTRYSLMTGRYNWRSRLQQGVLGGLSPRLIEPGRQTIASLLKEHGYHTACIGKWHLGMDWARHEGKDVTELNIEKQNQHWNVDYAKPIANGPTTVGFDYYFGIAASLDMVPFTFIENDRVTKIPTVEKKWIRKGPAAEDFEAADVLPTLVRKAGEYAKEHAADAKAGHPFFLYVPLTSPHTPIVPTREWNGRSGISAYADFVMETDSAVGEILASLDREGVAGNTIVVFTSDNGCSPAAGIDVLRKAGHEPNGPLRGTKADLWDGGHRVPFIVRWPGKVAANTVSDQLVSLVDWMATCAELVGAKFPDNAAEDSTSILPVLLGNAQKPVRETLVHHSITGRFAIREGHWKLCLSPGSGGWSAPRDPEAVKRGLPPEQLYDLASDLAETKNVAANHPEIVERLTQRLKKLIADGRSTPGTPQENTVPVVIQKPITAPAKDNASQD